MKTYSDLLAIDPSLFLTIDVETIGEPNYCVKINGQTVNSCIDYQLPLLCSIVIEIELQNKIYSLDHETALVIKRLAIDNIDLIPTYTHLAQYTNDHNFIDPTSYLGFNGKWTLTIDRPFYQWLHQAQNQGWLLD